MWPYAIHGKNTEIILQLEENIVQSENLSYKNCYLESIKCHHNDIANYFLTNYLSDVNSQIAKEAYLQCIKYQNFVFIQNELIGYSSLYKFCKYDYYELVYYILENNNAELNNTNVLTIAIVKGNNDIVKLLIANNILDSKSSDIFFIVFFLIIFNDQMFY